MVQILKGMILGYKKSHVVSSDTRGFFALRKKSSCSLNYNT